jgi:hypothetical protein
MATTYAKFMTKSFGQKINLEGMTTASTDFGESVLRGKRGARDGTVLIESGNVCYKFPSIHPGFSEYLLGTLLRQQIYRHRKGRLIIQLDSPTQLGSQRLMHAR